MAARKHITRKDAEDFIAMQREESRAPKSTPAEPKTIRVQVIISMDVDVDAYRAEFGAESVAEIRSGMQWSAFNAVAQTTLPSDVNDVILSNVSLLNPAQS